MATEALNPVYMDDIFEAGGETLAREVTDTFLEEVPRRMGAMQEALAARDWAGASLAAHAIVSGASMLGLAQVAAAARRVELVAGEGRYPPAADLATLRSAVTDAPALLHAAIARLAAGGEAGS